MKKFLIKISPYILLLLIGVVFLLSKADGYIDPFYMRFCSTKQNSLIIGTSRAAQSLQPQILNPILGRKDLYNFSFTIGHSPYGPAYYNLIKKKISKNSHNGVFIVTVDPWSISSFKQDDPNDYTSFKENESFVGKMMFVNMSPNIQYLLSFYDEPLVSLLKNKDSLMFLHDDGWLEVNVPMDSVSFQQRFNEKIETYKSENLPCYKFSSVRLDYLSEIIMYLKPYGNVFLVRLPIHPQMMDIENELMPDFNNKMVGLSARMNVDYFDMTYLNADMEYTDGNHLYKESGKVVSEIVANRVKGLLN